VWIFEVENWNFKINISMWSVWNLKMWKLKCLNLDLWILKVENWILKFLCENFKRNMKIWKLKCLNIENLKLKTEMFKY